MSIQAFTVCFDEAGLPDNYKFCLAALRERYPDLLIITDYPPQYDPAGDYRYDSDVTRIYQLTKPGNWLYLDIDTVVYQDYELADTSAPMFIHDSGIPDISVIMSHGHTEFFRELLITEQAKNPNQNVGCYQSMLWYLRDKIGLLPKGYYKHLGLSGTINREERNEESRIDERGNDPGSAENIETGESGDIQPGNPEASTRQCWRQGSVCRCCCPVS